MAHLWLPDDANAWRAMPLTAEAFALAGASVEPLIASSATAGAGAVLLRRVATSPDTWAILGDARHRLRVNGAPVLLGVAVLADRDEIRLPTLAAWFSTETRACVEPFPSAGARGFCPRCKQAIEAGTAAVRCPSCSLWHHASDDLPCWTYAPTCAACPQETALDAGFRWTPEDL
jgi:hypothetical protein